MPVVTIRVSAEVHERYLAMCTARDTTPGEMGRKLIEAAVDRVSERPDTGLASQVAALPARKATPGIRGFALDGSPIPHDTRARPK